jgi:hypothetical protein
MHHQLQDLALLGQVVVPRLLINELGPVVVLVGTYRGRARSKKLVPA